jgi:hypothetical protein
MKYFININVAGAIRHTEISCGPDEAQRRMLGWLNGQLADVLGVDELVLGNPAPVQLAAPPKSAPIAKPEAPPPAKPAAVPAKVKPAAKKVK